MRIVEKMIEHIHEELEGAAEYAEKYIECKALGHSARANAYKSMAEDELQHAQVVYDFAAQDMMELRKAHVLPQDADEKWAHCQRHFAEKKGIVKMMIG